MKKAWIVAGIIFLVLLLVVWIVVNAKSKEHQQQNTNDIKLSDIIDNNGKDIELNIDYGNYSNIKIVPINNPRDGYTVINNNGDGIVVSLSPIKHGYPDLYFDYYVENNDKNNSVDGLIMSEITIYDKNGIQISDNHAYLCDNKIDPGTKVSSMYETALFGIGKNTKISKIYIKLF